jgi:hypothetical protein
MILYDTAEGGERLKASTARIRSEPSAGMKALSEAGNDAFAAHGDELTGRGYVRDEHPEGVGANIY